MTDTYDTVGAALCHRDRMKGFAVLLRDTFEHGCGMDSEELRCVARLAVDLSDDAGKLYERMRSESLARAEAVDPIIAAIAERERLNAAHEAAIRVTDAAQESGDEVALAAADMAQTDACHAVSEWDEHILTMRPQNLDSALALLRFVAMIGRDAPGHEREKSDVVCTCVDLIEQESRA